MNRLMQNIQPDSELFDRIQLTFDEIQLTDTNEFNTEDFLKIRHLSPLNLLKVLLNLPLPILKKPIGGKASDNPGTTTNRIDDQKFEANGISIEIKKQHYQETVKVTVPLTDSRSLTAEQFERAYVDKFLESFPSFEKALPEMKLPSPNDFQKIQETPANELELMALLTETLFKVIKEPLEYSLDLHRNDIIPGAIKFLECKGLVISGGNNLLDAAYALLNSSGSSSGDTSALGIATQPDITYGIFFPFKRNDHNLPVLIAAVGVGELKVSSLDLLACYAELKKIANANKITSTIPETKFESGPTRERLINLEDTLLKLLTIATHTGCNKAILSDGSHFLLVHMDSSFKNVTGALGKKHRAVDDGTWNKRKKRKIQFGQKRKKQRKTQSEKEKKPQPEKKKKPEVTVKTFLKEGKHILLDSNMDKIRLYILCFLFLNEEQIEDQKTFRSKVTSLLKRELEKRTGSSGQNPLPQPMPPPTTESSPPADEDPQEGPSNMGTRRGLDSLHQNIVSGSSQPSGTDRSSPIPPSSQSSFSSIASTLKRDVSERIGMQKETGSSILKYQYRGRQDTISEIPASSASNIQSQQYQLKTDFSIHGSIFVEEYQVDIGNMLEKYIRVGRYIASQVLLIDSQMFCLRLPDENKCFKGNISGPAILKVFDPWWCHYIPTEGLEQQFCSYQFMIDLCINEAKAYTRLKELQGKVIPEILAVGRLLDVHVPDLVGNVYFRFWGPFILMTDFTKLKDPDFHPSQVDKEFIDSKIIPQLRRIHACGILHGDIKLENMAIIKDDDGQQSVRFLDFSHSKVSKNKLDFKREIKSVYEYFELLR